MSRPDLDRAVDVYDAESSRLLATCSQTAGEGHHLTFCCEHGNGALLTYYFGKGKREVLVRAGRNEGLAGHLGTHWRAGHREWTVDY